MQHEINFYDATTRRLGHRALMALLFNMMSKAVLTAIDDASHLLTKRTYIFEHDHYSIISARLIGAIRIPFSSRNEGHSVNISLTEIDRMPTTRHIYLFI